MKINSVIVVGYAVMLMDAYFAGYWFQEALSKAEPAEQFFDMVMSLWMLWFVMVVNRSAYTTLKRINE
jgi:hypothetical protein